LVSPYSEEEAIELIRVEPLLPILCWSQVVSNKRHLCALTVCRD